MSDSVRPHRQQPTRLLRPWDSPGKNTGVGCHFLLHCVKVKSESEVARSCPTLSDPMDCSLPGSMGFSRQEYWSGLPLPYLLSCAQLFAVPWTVACQAPMYMEFSRQEYCSHFLFQGIFLTQGSNQCPCISCIDRQILYH